MSEVTSQALTWIRDAYPSGVPDADAPALVQVLRQRLGDGPAYQVAFDLVAHGHLSATAASGEGAVAAGTADLRRVSAALVMGGWPLGGPVGVAEDDDDTEPGSYLGRIIAWLREGYPYGVPEHDYQPLLAILERRLTRGEVKKIAKALRRTGAVAGPADIAAAIASVTHSEASAQDLTRVRDHLAKKGWPVEFPDPEI